MIIVLFRLIHRTVPSVDFGDWTVWVNIWIWCLVLTVVFSLFRFLVLWKAIKDMLRVFTSLPLLEAYGRVPPALSRTFGRYLGQFGLTRLGLSIPVQQWIEVARGYDAVKPKLVSIMYGKSVYDVYGDQGICFTNIGRAIKGMDTKTTRKSSEEEIVENNRAEFLMPAEEAAENIQTEFLRECFRDHESDSDMVADSVTFQGLRQAAIAGLHILVPYWRSRSVEQQFGESPDGGSPETGRQSDPPKKRRLQMIVKSIHSSPGCGRSRTFSRSGSSPLSVKALCICETSGPSWRWLPSCCFWPSRHIRSSLSDS